MKKSFFLLAVSVLLLQVSVFAQKTRVGVTAGISSSNMYGEIGGTDIRDDSKKGITVGILIDAPIKKSRFSFQPSINYVQKGRIFEETEKVKSWVALRYAEVNFDFVYNSKGKTTFFVGLGPSAGLDLPSTFIVRTNNSTAANNDPDPKYSRSEKKVLFGKEVLDNFKGLDYGVHLQGGFRINKGLIFSLNYTFGLRNIASEGAPNDNIKNGYFAARFGWLFKNK
jgi:Outer membrane protein beta-barrel domain